MAAGGRTFNEAPVVSGVRARFWVFAAGVGMCLVASIPIAFVVAALQADGGWAVLAVFAALFTAPLLALWLLGPRLVLFAIRGIPVPGGNIWRWRLPVRPSPRDTPRPSHEQTIEGEFEEKR